jgi:hypothetical protein
MKRVAIMIGILLLLAGCGDDETVSNEETDTERVEESASVVFQNLNLLTEENEFHLTGEVSTENNVFYYKIEQSESGEVIQEEESYEVEETGDWANFEIKGEIASEFIGEEEAPIIVMYGKESDGEMTDPNYIPIDFQ